jgi:peptidoglycan/LPS O-acetylase OafA/YrhL
MLEFAVPAVNKSWFAPFLAGDIAVLVFFVLSGDALSNAFFSGGGNEAIDRLLVCRYLRLTIPILFSCFITYLIMKLGLDFHIQASMILQSQNWLGQFLQFKASFIGLLRYSLIGVYVSHTKQLAYNPVLWTMSIELIGSMAVFLLSYLWMRLKNPHWVCIGITLTLTLLGSFFSLFFAGMLLGYFRQQGVLEKLAESKLHGIFTSFIIVAIGFTLIATNGMHKPTILNLLLAMMLVFSFYTHKEFKQFFCNKLSLFLGNISFPLYLIHFQVLISLMSWLVVQRYTIKGYLDQNEMLGIAVATVLVSLISGWLFRYLERGFLKYTNSLVLRVLK